MKLQSFSSKAALQSSARKEQPPQEERSSRGWRSHPGCACTAPGITPTIEPQQKLQQQQQQQAAAASAPAHVEARLALPLRVAQHSVRLIRNAPTCGRVRRRRRRRAGRVQARSRSATKGSRTVQKEDAQNDDLPAHVDHESALWIDDIVGVGVHLTAWTRAWCAVGASLGWLCSVRVQAVTRRT